MNPDQDAIEAFQKALLQAQNNPEPKQTPAYESLEGNSDGELVFSGSVSPDTTTVTQSNPALFTVYDEKEGESNQFWGLFLMGMIGLPIITGFISIILISGIEDPYQSNEYWSSNASIGGNVTIQDETYYVYEFNLGPEFESNHPPEGDSIWNIYVSDIRSGTLINESYPAHISGNSWGPYLFMHQENIVDGDIWYEMNYNEMSNESAFIKFDRQEVNIATKSPYTPESVEYWAQEEVELGTNSEIYGFLSSIIWPISIIGGLIWGFKTDRKPFAYGIMTAGLLAIVLPFAALLLIIMVYGY